jgi:hypothetical protein
MPGRKVKREKHCSAFLGEGRAHEVQNLIPGKGNDGALWGPRGIKSHKKKNTREIVKNGGEIKKG